MTTYNDLAEAIDGLKKEGYVRDFNLAANGIACAVSGQQWNPDDFVVDAYYRFEGMSNPDDSSIIYAISAPDGVKGTLVNAFGVYAESLSVPMIKKLSVEG